MPEIQLELNGEERRVSVEPVDTLLDMLRDKLGLTGAKRGCDMGDCGACTVRLDGEPVNACLVLALEADGCKLQTIEDIEHPILETYAKLGSFQCGFCAPGLVVSTTGMLENDPHPSDELIRTELTGHLCRCTGYKRLIKALRGEEDSFEPDPEYKVVGRGVLRKDIHAKIRGRTAFTADLRLPNMVHGALVGSDRPHARIIEIDTSAAAEMAGVVLILSGEDVPDTTYGVSPARRDETVLAKGVVRHVGEAVVAVFARSRRQAELAAATVQIRYEDLPVLVDPEAAKAEGATQIHPHYPGNVNTEIHQDFGDLDAAFDEAFLIRDDVFHGHRTHQAYLEPPAALAAVDGDQITLWTANQTPHYVRYNVARTLDMPMSRLRVIKPAMGGGFGGKAEATKLDYLAVIAAQRLGRPVMMEMDRGEVFHHGRGRHGQTIRLKTAYAKDGTILGTHEQVTLDGGAYTSYGIITTYYSGSLLTTPYKLPSFRFDAWRMVTNLPTCGAQRGNGTPYPRFAFESQLDMAAADLGLDPVAIRQRNLIPPEHTTVNDLEITSCGVDLCLEQAVEMSGFDTKHGKMSHGRGIGLGLGCFISGAGGSIVRGDDPHSACTIRIDSDGRRAFLYTGAPEIGQGSDTVLCQIAAEALGLDYDDVSILSSDSAVSPRDLGAYASRVTFMAGNATIDAAKGIKRQLREFWAEELGEDIEIELSDAQVIAGERSESFAELAKRFHRKNGPLVATGAYSPPSAGGSFKGASVGTSPAYSFCAVVAEVSVDLETGRVVVDRFWAAHDSGTVINPVTFHGQVEGALVMGMGETLSEKVEHSGGYLRNPNFHDYLLPTIADAPVIESSSVPVRDPNGPFGAKEVGEGTILPVMGAIANAVADAIGVRITELPITAEKVWTALKNTNDEGKHVERH